MSSQQVPHQSKADFLKYHQPKCQICYKPVDGWNDDMNLRNLHSSEFAPQVSMVNNLHHGRSEMLPKHPIRQSDIESKDTFDSMKECHFPVCKSCLEKLGDKFEETLDVIKNQSEFYEQQSRDLEHEMISDQESMLLILDNEIIENLQKYSRNKEAFKIFDEEFQEYIRYLEQLNLPKQDHTLQEIHSSENYVKFLVKYEEDLDQKLKNIDKEEDQFDQTSNEQLKQFYDEKFAHLPEIYEKQNIRSKEYIELNEAVQVYDKNCQKVLEDYSRLNEMCILTNAFQISAFDQYGAISGFRIIPPNKDVDYEYWTETNVALGQATHLMVVLSNVLKINKAKWNNTQDGHEKKWPFEIQLKGSVSTIKKVKSNGQPQMLENELIKKDASIISSGSEILETGVYGIFFHQGVLDEKDWKKTKDNQKDQYVKRFNKAIEYLFECQNILIKDIQDNHKDLYDKYYGDKSFADSPVLFKIQDGNLIDGESIFYDPKETKEGKEWVIVLNHENDKKKGWVIAMKHFLSNMQWLVHMAKAIETQQLDKECEVLHKDDHFRMSIN